MNSSRGAKKAEGLGWVALGYTKWTSGTGFICLKP